MKRNRYDLDEEETVVPETKRIKSDPDNIVPRRSERIKNLMKTDHDNNCVTADNTNSTINVINTISTNNTNIWDKLNNYEKCEGSISEKDDWVSATAIRNHLLHDPLIDWLDRYYINNRCNDGSTVSQNEKSKLKEKEKIERDKMSVLFSNGLAFEEAVFKELKRKYPNDCVQVANDGFDVTNENYQKTVNYMKTGTPIILQAVLINTQNKTRGMADIIIRSDYINKLFGEAQVAIDEENIPAPNLGSANYHYRVIDVKWTTIHLCSNGKLIRNSERIPAYKGQLAIYTCILGHTQGYYPNQAYILGHSYSYETCGEKYNGSSCFDLLGHIDYNDFDKPYIERTVEAIKWVRNVRANGAKWQLIPPSVPELYPNMSNTNDTP